MVLGLFEAGDARKFFRVARRQLELAPLTANDGAFAGGIDPQLLIGIFSQDRSEMDDGEHGAAGGIHVETFDVHADADFHIRGAERGSVFVHVELDVGQDFLGAAAGGKQGGRLERSQQFFAIANNFHRSVLRGRRSWAGPSWTQLGVRGSGWSSFYKFLS